MKTHQGIAVLPVLAIIGAVLALVGAWFLFQSTSDSTKRMEQTNTSINRNVAINTNTSLNVNTAVNTNVVANTNTAKPNNIFSFDGAKVGDTVAGMAITKIGKFREGASDIEENRSVEFSGQVIVTGRVVSENSMGSTVRLTVDPASENLLPKLEGETRNVWFGFSNAAAALKEFPLGTDSQQTVVIDHYTINQYPSEISNMAELISASVSIAGWKTYTNTKDHYSVKYPKEWAVDDKESVPYISYQPSDQIYGADGDISISFRVITGVSGELRPWFAKNYELTAAKIQETMALVREGKTDVGPGYESQTFSNQDTTVDGKESIIQIIKATRSEYIEGPPTTRHDYFIKNDEKVYRVLAVAPTGIKSDGLMSTFRQMMSTFTFTK